MVKIVLTGAIGFIGQNLGLALSARHDFTIFPHDIGDNIDELQRALFQADVVIHLAGINRPQKLEEFVSGNVDFSRFLFDAIRKAGRHPRFVISSSIQAAMDNPYGASKKAMEDDARAFATQTGSELFIYRFPNVFGKWARPFYNSVIATFCHQLAHKASIIVDNRDRLLEFVYIDDVIRSIIDVIDGKNVLLDEGFAVVKPTYSLTLGELADILKEFAVLREKGNIPDCSNLLKKYLWTTFLTYLNPEDFDYSMDKKKDERGYLCEFLKSNQLGQIFISRTKPGIVRGNHYHNSKVEKFLVIEGKAKISLRHVVSGEVVSFDVQGNQCRVVDIPAGWTHNIKNTGGTDLITIFWANEIFDPNNPDTIALEV